MFKYLQNNEINNFINHKRSYRKYWFKFMDSKIKYIIWWDCTFKRQIIETIISLCFGDRSSAGMSRYIRFRGTKAVKAWEWCIVKVDGQVTCWATVLAKKGGTVSHSVYLSRNMDDDSNCGIIFQFSEGKTMGDIGFRKIIHIMK